MEVTHTQAKKLTKKPMSEKQKANIEKLVELNRLKWEEKKREKSETQKKLANDKVQIVVKPKRVYLPKRDKEIRKEEVNDDSDSYHSANDGYQKKRTSKPKKYSSEEETEPTETETEPERHYKPKKRVSKSKKLTMKLQINWKVLSNDLNRIQFQVEFSI